MVDSTVLLLLASTVAAIALPPLGYWLVIPILEARRDPHALSYRHTYITDPTTGATAKFPSLVDDNLPAADRVTLSIVVPAYNEEQRLDVMMSETIEYLEGRVQEEAYLQKQQKPSNSSSNGTQQQQPYSYEVIIVDDGSTDRTTAVALEWTKRYTSNRVRVLTLSKNQGKGGAVQQGMLCARGDTILFADADGATRITDLKKCEDELRLVCQRYNKAASKQQATPPASIRSQHGIVIGSRSHLEEIAIAKRAWYRNLLMYGFHLAVTIVGGVRGIKDTQCGFKLFTRKTAQCIVPSQRLRRWCFDVELLSLAQRQGIPIGEVAVGWHEVPGSKIRIISSSLMMARDLFVIRVAYATGIWRIESVDGARKRRQTFAQR